ncbi:putative alcohol dehydrogenase-like protein [Rosellinia necatrix]|uniref:Putative alcohol dehydrogenase-like protein n=1 Tax=Rosellinia necatrix TaxID=77044 RepID=A0A1S8A773_ROSNE|nr:putative alcohol dehydrogenase-like protein [Rosellinia necatrix]
MGRAGGRHLSFELVPLELPSLRRTVKANWVLGLRMTGTEITLGREYGYLANAE